MSKVGRVFYSLIVLTFVFLSFSVVVYAEDGNNQDNSIQAVPGFGERSGPQENPGGNDHQDHFKPAAITPPFRSTPPAPQPSSESQTVPDTAHFNPSGEQQKPETSFPTDNEIEQELQRDEIKAVTFTANNGELELNSETATGSMRPIGPNGRKDEPFIFRIRETSGSGSESSKIQVLLHNNKIAFGVNGNQALTNFPLSIDENGQLVVNTPNGPRVIRVLPDKAAAIATESGIIHKIDTLELDQNSASASAEPVFTATGTTPSTLLGFIPVDVNTKVEIGAQSGRVLSTNEPFWAKLLAPFIKPI